ncbi:MAG: RluA family pseudouridine synthase, partial [Vicinamibacterales bacterium]
GGFLDSTLLTLVRTHYPDARPMHRLGRYTSGVVLFARTHAAAASLAAAWRDHAVKKHYRALGSGVAVTERLEINARIGPVAHPVLGSVHGASASGKRSHSVAHVLERREHTTVFQVEITTGRPHQIRIHLAYAGHPLVGDPVYVSGGLPRADRPGLPGEGGYWLHAERLQFVHPASGAMMELGAPPPPELCTGVLAAELS